MLRKLHEKKDVEPTFSMEEAFNRVWCTCYLSSIFSFFSWSTVQRRFC
jgi:hypothetical protein